MPVPENNQSVFVARYLIHITLTLLAAIPAQNSRADSRTVVFPIDRSLGRLLIRDANDIDTSNEWWWGQFLDWQYTGEATGKVAVPAGKKLALLVSSNACKDLSPLNQLQPDALDTLVIQCRSRDSVKPGDNCLPLIGSLTGLKTLILEYSGISNNGLKLLTNMPSLAQLSFISEQLDDTGLAQIAEIKSLKALRFYSPKVTNTGLSHLAKLTLLEEFFPDSRNIDDDSMAHFAKLPNLRYLLLSGEKISEQGLIHLQDLKSLKKLEFLRPPISEQWMENLSKLVQLEELAIQNTPISDEQIKIFKPPSLTKLRLQGGFRQREDNFTDEGLAHLAQIKSIESLELYYGDFTDKGMEHLSELSNLRTLVIPNCHRFTDSGLKHLADLKNLEHLNIGSGSLTDDGIAVIGRLASLKELMLFNGRLITNQGLANLSTLKALKKLELLTPKVTTSGLNHLDALHNLAGLEVRGGYAKDIEPDDSVLNIENLTRLERLQLPVFCDEDLACLAKLRNLRWLEITNRRTLTDKGLAHLKLLSSLNRLAVTNAHLTDEGLLQIANMNRLDNLTISGDFTEQGLRHLEGLKGLIYLRIISANSLSSEALQRLQDALPNLLQIQMEVSEPPEFTKPKLQAGRKLPDFENIDIEFSAGQNKDNAILICFFDMQQRPSRSCLQKLAERADELVDKGIIILAVQTSKMDKKILDEWGKKLNIAFPLGIISSNINQTRLDWNIDALPRLILTDRNHTVRAEGFSIDELDEKITELGQK